MRHWTDLLLTALAPMIWGSTYIVTTTFLPGLDPMLVALLRALPAGLLMLLFVRRLPTGLWWLRIFVLGALNFSIFWWMLFLAAYRLPGGVAATVGAVQPLIVVFLARLALGSPIRSVSLIAAVMGLVGVGLLILTPDAALDTVGIAAGLTGAVSMAAGTVLTRRWRPPVPLLTFTAWQLTAGGILLLPVLFIVDLAHVEFTLAGLGAILYLGPIGAVVTYWVWFRGIARLDPNLVSPLGFLSPTVAVLLGWLLAGEHFSGAQILGFGLIAVSILMAQWRRKEPVIASTLKAATAHR
ncbi:EamA family transporter [Rhizobium sp. L1K21]|uniref:EamA family transporter n=1 Tax=Rhizobium sp. L1K21 TaxID=2954933 RepID=UPI0020924769|nr:EamA family transporter [Rhizobium sp. L1K21]MCO6186647.1 EamA family transporter [Rhizobium sp. L1K21]